MNLTAPALATLLLALAAPLSTAVAQGYPPPSDYRWGQRPAAAPQDTLPDDDEDDPVIYSRRTTPRGYPDRVYRDPRDLPPEPQYGHALPDSRDLQRPLIPDSRDPQRAGVGVYAPPAGDPPPVIYGGRGQEIRPQESRPTDSRTQDQIYRDQVYRDPAYRDQGQGYRDQGSRDQVYSRPIEAPGRVPQDPMSQRPPAEVYTGSTQAAPSMARAVPGQVVPAAPGQAPSVMMLPEEDQPEQGAPKELPPHLKRQMVDYRGKEPAGTIVVDTANTYLYLVMGGGKAMRYGIGVGRQGFTWAGKEKISRKTEWPDWHPPEEMIERQPYLPRFMAGGPGNPMGARALYLGKTLYRIHGTNQPSTIGSFVSSGCIRLLNEDIEDLFERAKVGTQVVVLPGNPPATATRQPAAPAPAASAAPGALPPQGALPPPPAREADAGVMRPTAIIPR